MQKVRKYTKAKPVVTQKSPLPSERKPFKFQFSFDNFLDKWKMQFKQHDSSLQFILFPAILLVIVITLALLNNKISTSLEKNEYLPTDIQTQIHPYPYLQAANQPQISAQAAIILDRDSQVIVYTKNPQLHFSMASTTKIMTALVALDYYHDDDILTVKRASVPGSGLHLYQGEKFSFIDLLYAMLLPSANDAAQAVADNYPGGSEAFVKKMNAKARSFHLFNTHYADPTGLDDDGDYTTVVDLARLASSAVANPAFVAVTSTKFYSIHDIQYTRQYDLENLNKLLGIDGVTGIKTGTTEGAGEVLVTSTTKNGHTYIIIVMHSDDRFEDTKKLLNLIDTNVHYFRSPIR